MDRTTKRLSLAGIIVVAAVGLAVLVTGRWRSFLIALGAVVLIIAILLFAATFVGPHATILSRRARNRREQRHRRRLIWQWRTHMSHELRASTRIFTLELPRGVTTDPGLSCYMLRGSTREDLTATLELDVWNPFRRLGRSEYRCQIRYPDDFATSARSDQMLPPGKYALCWEVEGTRVAQSRFRLDDDGFVTWSRRQRVWEWWKKLRRQARQHASGRDSAQGPNE